MIEFSKAVLSHYLSRNPLEKGAALAYYTVFSFLPMIVIIISLLGLFFGAEAIKGELFSELKGILGEQGALEIEGIIKRQHVNHNNLLTTILGFITLGLSATGMFNQIQSSFNAIWELKAKPRSSILNYLTRHLTSFSILITLGFILLLSTTVNSFFYKHSANLSGSFSNAYLYEHLTSFLLITLMFAMMYKFLGEAIVPWKNAFFTGLVTSTLFLVGKIAIGLYIAHSSISSTFGAASVIALLMMWVYYTSQIMFIGASFAYVFGERNNLMILPNEDSVRVTDKT